MSLSAARQLSKETGYQIDWIPKTGCYTLWDGTHKWFPLYTKERVLLIVQSLQEKSRVRKS